MQWAQPRGRELSSVKSVEGRARRLEANVAAPLRDDYSQVLVLKLSVSLSKSVKD